MLKDKNKSPKRIFKRGLICPIVVLVILFLTSLIFDKQILSFAQNIKEKYEINLGISFFENNYLMFYGVILALQILFIILDKKIKKKKKKIPILFISLLVVEAVVVALKIIISRQRPQDLLSFSGDKSFPSGHTAFAFTALPFLKSKTLKSIWLVISIIIGLSRVWQGVHYLSDVIAGAVLGYIIPLLILKIANKKNE
ncbi:MAG: phosphatase PAP2 family protein [Candidatus Pacearchaeota archaeon]|nr:phosphatase PAP2 family protein [Candidatus Pacearchaeota archaeon]